MSHTSYTVVVNGKLAIALVSLLAISCTASCTDDDVGQLADNAVLTEVPARGGDATLDIATWNIEWFGHSSNGPDDKELQFTNVRDILLGADLDIWGVQEIVYADALDDLTAKLPGYDGFLANDPIVDQGSDFYHRSEQKVGFLYKTDIVEVQSATIILTDFDYAFAGRPPLEVSTQVTLGGDTRQVIVIVMHAKALTDAKSLQRRKDGAAALKQYLDTTHADRNVIVIGDFNDDIDTSIRKGEQSPYKPFVDDSDDYVFATEALTLAGKSSTTRYKDVIDHHLLSDDLAEHYIADSAEAYLVDEYIDDYDATTTDHYPVISRYQWGGSAGSKGVIINEILANEPSSSTSREFIELVNTDSEPADLSGWTLSDGTSVRHVFGDGALLDPGQAIVVFGDDAGVPGNLDNAVAASTGALSLRNSGELVTLGDAQGKTIDAFDYPQSLASRDGISMTRKMDGSGVAMFVLHDSLSSLAESPGLRSDGSAW